jgi:uncharacterized RDD family membrane protein YckC
MVFCTNCGAQNQDNAQFCTGCGAHLSTAVAPTSGQPSEPMGPRPPIQPGPSLSPPVSYPTPVSYAASPGPPLPPGATYAVWADRVVGYLIDSLLVGAGMLVLYLVLGGLFAMLAGLGSNLAGGMCCMMILIFPLATLLVGLYNRVYLVAQRGSSIGQGIMKLKVVDINGNLLNMQTALIRLLAQVGLSFVPMVGPLLDLLWPLWDEKRQTLHDKAVGSFVLKLPS